MRLIAEGPLANDVIAVRQVIPVVAAADLPAAPTGHGRADVTGLLDGADPNGIVGRSLDVSTPATPTLVAVVAPTVLAVRRAALKSRLRQLEATPQLSIWRGADDGLRARSFARWIHMIAHASATDSNLTADGPHALIVREAAHDARTWYWLHYLAAAPGQTATTTGMPWSMYLSPDNDDWTSSSFYCTAGPDAAVASARTSSVAPNTRGAVGTADITAGAGVARGPDDFNLAAYLGSE